METTMQALRSNVAARLQNYRHDKRIKGNVHDEYTLGFVSLLKFTAEDVGDHRSQEQAERICIKLARRV